MNKLTIGILTAAIIAALGFAAAAPQGYDKAEAAFKAAYEKEVVDGDLKSAITQYEKLVRGSNRAVAGKALVRVGQCYEKLGDKEARKAYERAIRDFADQPEVLSTAKARLAAIGGGSGAGVSSRQLYSFPGLGPEQRFSLDGRLYVISENGGGISVREVATGRKRLLPKSGNPEFIAISRDGKQVAFCSWGQDPKTNRWICELRIIGVDGSNSRTLPYGTPDMMAGPSDWSPDGKHLLVNRWPGASGFTDMLLINVDSGELKVIGKAPFRRGARFSPDGRYIVFEAAASDGPDGPKADRDIYVMAADGSQETAILSGPSKDQNAVWSPDGSRIFFVSDRSGSSDLWSIRFENGRTAGEPRLVQHGFPGRMIDVTRDGTIYYGVSATMADVYLVGLDPVLGKATNTPQRLTHVGINRTPVWSPDGKTLAYFSKCAPVNSFRDTPEIVLRGQDGKENVIKERFRGSCAMNPLAWLPDGRSLLVRQLQQQHALEIATGETRPVFPGFDARGHAWLAPDGKFIYHAGWDMQGGLYRRDEAGNATLIANTSDFTKGIKSASLSLSPDGSRLAILDSGRVRVLSSQGGPVKDLFQPRPGISTLGPMTRTVWSPDGKFVYFSVPIDDKHTTVRLWRVSAEGGEPSLVLEIPDVAILAPSIHPGGRQIAFSTDQTRSETWELRNVISRVNAEP